MSSIFDAAKYILAKCGEMSTMKLQKMCYYSQAWSLVWDDAEMFSEDFEAWANGPVCPQLFNLHRGKFLISQSDIDVAFQSDLTNRQKQIIDAVIDFYGSKDAQWLSTLTHMEDPWKLARSGVPVGSPSSNPITKESMSMYYGSL